MSLGKHILIYINFLSKIPNINFSVSKGPMFYFTWSSLRKWENKPNIFCSGWFCNRLNGRDLHFHFAITYIRDALAYHTYKLSRNTSTPFSCSLHRRLAYFRRLWALSFAAAILVALESPYGWVLMCTKLSKVHIVIISFCFKSPRTAEKVTVDLRKSYKNNTYTHVKVNFRLIWYYLLKF